MKSTPPCATATASRSSPTAATASRPTRGESPLRDFKLCALACKPPLQAVVWLWVDARLGFMRYLCACNDAYKIAFTCTLCAHTYAPTHPRTTQRVCSPVCGAGRMMRARGWRFSRTGFKSRQTCMTATGGWSSSPQGAAQGLLAVTCQGSDLWAFHRYPAARIQKLKRSTR